METFLGQWVFDALHHGLVYLASRRRNTETIGGGQLLIEFLGLMAVVWCDRFVFLTIYREANQEKQDKEKETKETKLKPSPEADKNKKQQSSAVNPKQKKAKNSEGLQKSAPQTPKLAKATPYEFMQAWNSLRTVKDLKPYAGLLEQIQPEDLPKGENIKIYL